MGDFLRSNRYASVILTTALLVLVGVVVAVARSDGSHHPGVVLRADQQALQPQGTTPSPFGPVVPHATAPTGPPLTLGKIGSSQVSARHTTGNKSGAGSTATTARQGGGAATTTTISPSVFGTNRVAYIAGGSAWTINPDGTDARNLVSSGYSPAWSPDHDALAYADKDSPGGALSIVTASGSVGLTTGVAQDSQPAWSSDGSKLAFARIDNSASDGYSGIWTINRNGSNLHRVAVSSGCFNRDPAWSPDGSKIAFWSSRKDCGSGRYELYVLDVASGDVTALGTATNSEAPAWSPDGTTIAFASDGYGGIGMEICLMDADGSNARRITNVSGDDTYPAWSPDGARIAFRSDRNEGGVYTMNADGSDVHLLVAGASQPSWR